MSSIVAVLLVATIVFGQMPPLTAAPADAPGQKAEQRRDVIVILKRGNDSRAIARDMDANPTQVYSHVIDGFAATLPPQAIRGLEHHPDVVAVVPDYPVRAFTNVSDVGDAVAAGVSPAPKKCKKIEDKKKRQRCIKKAKKGDASPSSPSEIEAPGPTTTVEPPPVDQPAQEIPTGINRIDADENAQAGIAQDGGAIDIDVAVLDTGIAAHPDLTIAGGASCLGGGSADDNGHGTHVAGTIAALDNDIGVVGVAPGARLWAVKVLDAKGDGSWSSVICGLDWVYANRNTIDAVNLSLGGDGADGVCGDSDPLHRAICRVVNEAGIPVVVAVGNQQRDATNTVPATYQEVIAVGFSANGHRWRPGFHRVGESGDKTPPGLQQGLSGSCGGARAGGH